jgi:dephospho-CoA kinase
MRLIIVAGMPGAGKEEFLTVARDAGIPFLRMGDLVREAYSERGPEDMDLTTGQFANAERDRHGFDIWAKRAVERMYGDVFLIDGCRSMDEVRAYRSITDDVHIVGIFSSPATRYERLVERARDDAPKNIGEFEARDKREIGWGLAETMALADMMIVNEGLLTDFHSDSKELLGRIV